MEEEIDVLKIYENWLESSDKDFQTMLHLFDSKDYSWSLFIGHIVIEKLLKAQIVIESKKHALFTHDLSKLAQKSNLVFSENQLDQLDTITTFNLNTRYDNYKQAFYKKCTLTFTNEWIENIKNIRLWIKEKQSQ